MKLIILAVLLFAAPAFAHTECKEQKLMPWNDSAPGKVGRNFCFPTSGNLPARKVGVSATVIGTPPGVSSDQRGAQQWSCTPRGWRLVSSYCK